jgi:uncharacterized membrane protein
MASYASAPVGEPVSIGRVIQRSFAVVAANPLVVLGIAFLFGAPPSVILSHFTQLYQAQLVNAPDATRDYVFLSIGSGVIGFILSMLVQGALVRATIAHLEGRKAGFAESLMAAVRVLLPLVGLAILVAIAVMFGLALFLVPGMIVYVIWSVASPALVAERIGIGEALGRSRRLTKGARWKVFGLQLIILVVYYLIVGTMGYGAIVASGSTEAVARAAAGGLPITWLVVNALISTLANTFWSTAQTTLYIELRDWKDGPSADTLADVFA